MEIFCANLVRGLRARGHAITVVTNRYEGRAPGTVDFEGTAVHGFAFHEVLGQADLKQTARLHDECSAIVDAFTPGLIHLHGMSRSIFHFLSQQNRRRFPSVITLHDNVEERPHMMAGPALKNATRIVAVSDYLRRATLSHIPRLAPRLRTILNALPASMLSPTPPHGQGLLAFGRLEEHKGFDVAIRAFAEIAMEFPGAVLTIAGDGPDREKLEALASELGHAPRIKFTGWLAPEEIPALINDHALIVVPSRWQEPFGLVALQAAQMGRPVIASRTGGLPEIVIDGVTGLLVENENIHHFADALRSLLRDPAQARQLGEAGRARAATHFRFDHLLDEYENIYREAIGEMESAPGGD